MERMIHYVKFKNTFFLADYLFYLLFDSSALSGDLLLSIADGKL